MNLALSKVFQRAATFSRIAAALAVLLAAITALFDFEIPLNVQVVIAIIALAIGIPHGAIDHLITIPRDSSHRFILFILFYTLIAISAGLAIAQWNLAGFQLVVLISALHFGFGDSAFFNESKGAAGTQKISFPILVAYALPAGFLPVVLPLTDQRTSRVLNKLNPAILNWSGSLTQEIRNLTFVAALFSILILLITKNLALALDLSLLAALSTLVPPLIAFSVYFGCWHAIRHTARLVPKLPRAMEKVSLGEVKSAFVAAVKPGLYAIVGIFLLGLAIIFKGTGDLTSEFLWSILVIIWALTVPHMATTSRFDLAAFKSSLHP